MLDTRKVPFFRPSISEAEIKEVSDSLRSGWLTTGPKTKRFEEEIAAFVGAKYAVALNSCTAALHLALEAIDLKRGDLVLVPTMTFAATSEIVRYFDAIPVFVDCDQTLCIDPVALEQTINAIISKKAVAGLKLPYGKIKAIIPVHYGGYACDMNTIMSIANNNGIDVIEDCAHTLPAFYRSDENADFLHTGRFGRVGCYSFYANKCITTGEGGMAVTDEENLARRIRLMSLHGMNNDAWKRFTQKGSWFYEIIAPGFKYNMTDIAASIGIHQLKRAEDFRQSRQSIAERYTKTFRKHSGLETPAHNLQTRIHSWHLYHPRLNLEVLAIDRNQFIDELKERGVLCSVHWMPLHLHPYYRQTFGLGEGLFPVAEHEWSRLVSLPIFPSMSDEEIDYVLEVVDQVINRFTK